MWHIIQFCIASLLLLLLLPVLIVVGFVVSLDGGTPIYRQKRVGRFGVEFEMYKFRSMVKDADKKGGYQTTECDPRVTSIGRFIRKTSLDELPQLVNVLLGQMSLVGPRPNVMAQKKEYTNDQWALRNSVKPGLTGLAQVEKRSSASWEERWNLDVEYIQRKSFVFDLIILTKTITALFLKKSN